MKPKRYVVINAILLLHSVVLSYIVDRCPDALELDFLQQKVLAR